MKVLSSIPGRLRISEEKIYKNEELSTILCIYLKGLNGVIDSRVNPITGSVLVQYDPKAIDVDEIQQEIINTVETRDEELAAFIEYYGDILRQMKKLQDAKMSMAIFGGIYLAFKLKTYLFGKYTPGSSLAFLEAAALVTIISGYPSLRRWLDEDNKSSKEYNNLLVMVGVLLTLLREGSKGILLLFLKASTDYLQAKASLDVKMTLLKNQPSPMSLVHYEDEGKEGFKPLTMLQVGDTIILKKDEPIFIEGLIKKGSAKLNCIFQNGHPQINSVEVGDKVMEGQVVIHGEIMVEVTRIPEFPSRPEVTLESLKIWQRMRNYQEKSLYLALPMAVIGYIVTGSIITPLSVLLVMNPTAAELSLTASLTHYLKRLLNKKILLRNIHTIEKLTQVNWVVFDKTGTLTHVPTKEGRDGEPYLYEELRPEAPKLMERLQDLGIEHFSIVSGDENEKVKKVAKMLTIQDYYSTFTPNEKAHFIEDNRDAKGIVLMVGDGVNDALAMRTADVSIAIGECEHAVMQADCALLSGDVERIADLIEISRNCYSHMEQNLTYSIIFNVGGGIFAMLGYWNLFQAESVNVLNSISAVLNGVGISVTNLQEWKEFLDYFRSPEPSQLEVQFASV